MLNRFLKSREAFINKFGLLNGYLISNKLYPKNKIPQEVCISVPGYLNKVHLRTNSSDTSTFKKVLMDEEYYFLPDFKPEFIIDGGANIGLSALFFSKLFKSVKIVVIEPESRNFRLLKQNLKGLKVDFLFGAVWNKKTNLKIKNIETNTSGFEIIETVDESQDTIKAFSIKEILGNSGFESIDVLKLDIEGSEKEVFSEDYESWLPKTKVLIIETHDRFKPGCTESLMNAISKYNFTKMEKGENIFFVNNSFKNTIKL